MENKIIYLCEDTPDGVFSAIYDVWAAGLNRSCFSIQAERQHSVQLFAEYRYIQTDIEKAIKVIRSVQKKIGAEAADWIYHAALSYMEDKIDCIYDFLKLAFCYGRKVMEMHGEDVVCRIYELKRSVGNEAHRFREFIRFHDSEEGILIGRINPKNQVLPLLAEHFADRFPEEDFVILDENYKMGLFHPKKMQWYIAPLELEILHRIWQKRQSAEYEHLWKTFFRTIAIKERDNYQCQRNLCAIRYRDYMVEFRM